MKIDLDKIQILTHKEMIREGNMSVRHINSCLKNNELDDEDKKVINLNKVISDPSFNLIKFSSKKEIVFNYGSSSIV